MQQYANKNYLQIDVEKEVIDKEDIKLYKEFLLE